MGGILLCTKARMGNEKKTLYSKLTTPSLSIIVFVLHAFEVASSGNMPK